MVWRRRGLRPIDPLLLRGPGASAAGAAPRWLERGGPGGWLAWDPPPGVLLLLLGAVVAAVVVALEDRGGGRLGLLARLQ